MSKLIEKYYSTQEQKQMLRWLFLVLVFLHLIFLPEYFALPSCIGYRHPFLLYRQNLTIVLLLAGLPLLAGKWGGRVLLALYGLWGFFNCLLLYSLVYFHQNLDYTVLRILFVTDPSEIQEFSSSFIHWYDFLPFIIVIGAVVACCRHAVDASNFSRKIGCLLIVPFFLVFLPQLCMGKLKWVGKRNALFRFCFTSIQQFRGDLSQMHQVALHPCLPEHIRSTSQTGDCEPILGVVIVGESARRSNFHCYGYPRDTTPCLDSRADECFFFDDVIAPANSTLQCCIYDFSDATVSHLKQAKYTLCDLLKGAGYKVALYSNQRRSGNHESLGLMFNHADIKKYLSEEGEKDGYDARLFHYLETSPLLATPGPSIIVLHTMGSHHHAAKRYPSTRAHFPLDFRDTCNAHLPKSCAEYVNHYDNSIGETDRLIGCTIELLSRLQRPAFLLYLSDHAEILPKKPSDKNFRDAKNPEVYEIPFVIFTNQAYRENYKESIQAMARNIQQPMQADSTIYCIASLARVTFEQFPYAQDITSAEFVPKQRYPKR